MVRPSKWRKDSLTAEAEIGARSLFVNCTGDATHTFVPHAKGAFSHTATSRTVPLSRLGHEKIHSASQACPQEEVS